MVDKAHPLKMFEIYDDVSPRPVEGQSVRTAWVFNRILWKLDVGDVLRITDFTDITRCLVSVAIVSYE